MQTGYRGYTLLELLITLTVLALLVRIALPQMNSSILSNRGEAIIGELSRTLSLARSAAVAEGRIVTICRSRNGRTCGGNWEDGMLVFTDSNGDRVPNGDDHPLKVIRNITGTLRLRSFPNRQYLQFTPLGFTNKQNGSFTWCPRERKSEYAQQLIFSQSGRTRTARDRNGDGIREGTDGAPLSCGA